MPRKSGRAATREFDPSPIAAPADVVFRFRIKGNSLQMNYPQAFAYAHRLLKGKQYRAAATVFNRLTSITDRGPRAHIMLAICLAGLSDYKKARQVLDLAFSGESPLLAAELQDIIVMARMGLKRDAMHDLVRLVNEHQELPSLCLWLGDMLEAKQDVKKARKCWKLAVRRDRAQGAVALAAKRQLRKYPKRRRKERAD